MPSLPQSLPPGASLLAWPAALLLAWYDRHRRVLPFRSTGGRPDPYQVWLSEVMLQQTTVAAVGPRFDRFLGRFPTVEALAAAPEGEVMEEWAGLGYYARARNLHACARLVAARGGFPETVEALRDLPGIGAYTAGAVSSFAYERRAELVDTNVARVIKRVFAPDADLKSGRASTGSSPASRRWRPWPPPPRPM